MNDTLHKKARVGATRTLLQFVYAEGTVQQAIVTIAQPQPRSMSRERLNIQVGCASLKSVDD